MPGVSNFIDVLWDVFRAFYAGGQTLVTFMRAPLLPSYVRVIVDGLIPSNNPVYDFLAIDSLDDITVLWGLGLGFAGFIVYAVVKWILDIVL